MFEHILLPLDGSSLAERVLPHAVALAQAFNSKLTLLRVVYQEEQADQHGVINPINWQMRKSEAEAYLKSIQESLREIEVKSDLIIREGRPAKEIIEFAHDEDVNLILLSSHGRSGPSEWNINSVVQKVLLRAFMPVMIVRAYRESQIELTGLTYDRIFVPMDLSTRAECVLPLARSIGSIYGSEIILAHIVEEPKLPRRTPLNDEDRILVEKITQKNTAAAKKYFRELNNRISMPKVKTIIQSSQEPTVALHNLIDREDIDLVLLSAHGYSGEARWPYGTIALNFIAYGTNPLIIIQDLSEDEVIKTMAEKYAEQTKGH